MEPEAFKALDEAFDELVSKEIKDYIEERLFAWFQAWQNEFYDIMSNDFRGPQ